MEAKMKTRSPESLWHRISAWLRVIISVVALFGMLWLFRELSTPAATLLGSSEARTMCPGDIYSASWEFDPKRNSFQASISIGWERVSPEPQKYAGRLAGTFAFLGERGESRHVTVPNLTVPKLTAGEYRMRVIASFAGGALTSYYVPVTIPEVCPIPPAATPQPLPAPAGTK